MMQYCVCLGVGGACLFFVDFKCVGVCVCVCVCVCVGVCE